MEEIMLATIVVQLIKDLLPERLKKYIPLGCVIGFIIGNYFVGTQWTTMIECIIQGTTLGLASCGLYEGVLKPIAMKKPTPTKDLPVMDDV